MADVMQQRRDTAANWTSHNPVLYPGQIGIETNTQKFKFGDEAGTAWNLLPYAIDTGTAEIWSGVGTINFGNTPTDEANLVITGLGNMTTSAHIRVFLHADDSTVDNSASYHETLSLFAVCIAKARVASVGFTVSIRLLAGQASGTFKVHYQYTL